MNDIHVYQIRIQGQVDENEINSRSPLNLSVEQAGPTTTLLSVCTDQSGLIGLIRHLHGLGLVFLSIICTGEE